MCSKNVDLWPPFSMSLTTMQSTNSNVPAHLGASGIFPTVYYIPVTSQPSNQPLPVEQPSYPPMADQPGSPFQFQYLYMPYFIAPIPSQQMDQMPGSAFNILQKVPLPRGSGNQGIFQRPASQATSLQANKVWRT